MPRSFRLLVLVAVMCAVMSLPGRAQSGGWLPGQSLSWQRTQAPSTPGEGAIRGGPGSDPSPGSPMFICRGQDGGSLVPGKWVRGACNVAFNNTEDVLRTYEVAYGRARWGMYRGDTGGLVVTGREVDGGPLFSCRVRYSSSFPTVDYGYQPGKLVSDGSCHIPFAGRELTMQAPFEVLYGAGGGYPPNPYPPSYPPPPAQLPGCQLSDTGVHMRPDGLWAGPNCTPSDGMGHIPGGNNGNNNGGDNGGNVSQAPPGPYQAGASSVSWQPAQSPYTPGAGAIVGAGGKGSKPNEPLYVCRAYLNGALLPGKWLSGQCSVSYAGKEQRLNSYEVASGSAEWRSFDGNVSALVPGGYDSDGTPLYICRARFSFLGSKGFQPGRLENGRCMYPYGGMEQVSGSSFEALYNVFSGGAAVPGQDQTPEAGTQPSGAAGGGEVSSAHGVEVVFTGGTVGAAGSVSVTNGSSGQVVTQAVPANSTAEQYVLALQQAAFRAGLQIQAEPGGMGVRVSGANNAIHVSGATVSIQAF